MRRATFFIKKETIRFFFCIAVFFCWLSLMSVACDPACHDKFYLKNTLDTPITYSQFNTKDSTQRNMVTIQPGESKVVYEYIGRDSQFEPGAASSYCDELQIPTNNYCHTVTFSDGTLWQWDLSNQINTDKHPYLIRCWNILSSSDTKHRSDHEVEYAVDSVDYQNAIQQKDDSQLEGCFAGVNTALDYYVKYKKELGKDKGAEQFLKMRDKGTLKSYLTKSLPE